MPINTNDVNRIPREAALPLLIIVLIVIGIAALLIR
jgi:hypothetical protein